MIIYFRDGAFNNFGRPSTTFGHKFRRKLKISKWDSTGESNSRGEVKGNGHGIVFVSVSAQMLSTDHFQIFQEIKVLLNRLLLKL